jgi:hypothetical protein
MDQLIPPEIVGDDFHQALVRWGATPGLRHYLEIGSSSGAGSTLALVTGIRSRTDRDDCRLCCMELSQPRFNALAAAYGDDRFVRCHNVSSVPESAFAPVAEVQHFYRNTRTNLNQYPLDTVLGWLAADIAYLRASGTDGEGIATVRAAEGLGEFDFVLIDGSEFTGERELQRVMGSRVIALDDVNSFKCFNAYRILAAHVGYELVQQNLALRNGYAVFQRRY